MAHHLLCMKDIPEGQLKWLWWPYIPMGCLTLIFGLGGIGKSHLIADFAARITNGEAFPHEKKHNRQPSNVLIMSAEDDPGEVMKPRLRAAGADMDKVFCPNEEFILDKAGIREMEGFMEECAATVVFLDPVVAFMGGKIDMFRANEVRSLMQPLNKAAQRTGTALVAVGHERKNKGGSMQDNAMGSVDFVNAARSSLYVAEDKMGKALYHAKSNYAKKGPPISFSFEDDGEDVVKWGDQRDNMDPIYGKCPDGDSDYAQRPAEKAEEFLVSILKDGPVASAEVVEEAGLLGINKRTLDRVKKKLRVTSRQRREDDKLVWYWMLPGQEG